MKMETSKQMKHPWNESIPHQYVLMDETNIYKGLTNNCTTKVLSKDTGVTHDEYPGFCCAGEQLQKKYVKYTNRKVNIDLITCKARKGKCLTYTIAGLTATQVPGLVNVYGTLHPDIKGLIASYLLKLTLHHKRKKSRPNQNPFSQFMLTYKSRTFKTYWAQWKHLNWKDTRLSSQLSE